MLQNETKSIESKGFTWVTKHFCVETCWHPLEKKWPLYIRFHVSTNAAFTSPLAQALAISVWLNPF